MMRALLLLLGLAGLIIGGALLLMLGSAGLSVGIFNSIEISGAVGVAMFLGGCIFVTGAFLLEALRIESEATRAALARLHEPPAS